VCAAAGLVVLAVGLLPRRDASATLHRVAPLLAFLVPVLVLAELAARAGLFDVVATRMAILAGGRPAVLFALAVGLATLTTVVLNLDTTAALLTPVLVATAVRAGIGAVPLAVTAVWLANTASLLLPVSNLTNLLAADRVGLPVPAFAARMILPQVAAVLVTAGCLWLFHWWPETRRTPRYRPPAPHRPGDRVLFRAAGVACAGFVVGVLAGVPVELVAAGAAATLVVAFAVRDRRVLRWALVPWQVPLTVTGLFLLVDAVDRHGLARLLTTAVGTDGGPAGTWRAAATGAVSANVLNNLPAYLAGEAVVPVGHTTQLLGLLAGTNVGSLVLPWGSLATLLWWQRCRAAGVAVPWLRFCWTGLVTAVAALAAVVAVLCVTA
jgi:arsenical pump membrane protein